jgi:hypothetical protein
MGSGSALDSTVDQSYAPTPYRDRAIIIPPHMRGAGQAVWIPFISVQPTRRGQRPYWRHHRVDFTSYEKLQGFLRASQRAGMKVHVVESTLPEA